jgi:hypothetical protein
MFSYSKPRQHYLPQGITDPGGRGCGGEIRTVSKRESVGANFRTLDLYQGINPPHLRGSCFVALLSLGYTVSYQHARQDVLELSLFVNNHEKQ